jgi:hypothetical protein
MPIDSTTSKRQVIAPAITAALVLMGAPILLQGAFAAPTLHGGLNCTFDEVTNTLNCQGDVSGLGGAETATATLSATAEVTTGCINRGAQGTEPQGLERESTSVSDTQELNVESGRATFDIDLSADLNRDCPDGMTPTLVCVTFSGITLLVDPSSGPSRTFNTDETFTSC